MISKVILVLGKFPTLSPAEWSCAVYYRPQEVGLYVNLFWHVSDHNKYLLHYKHSVIIVSNVSRASFPLTTEGISQVNAIR